jgi:glycosyltransferase involved in cell wall biosynthesis
LISKWHVSPEKIALIHHGVQQDQKRHILKPQVIPQSFSRDFIFTAGSIRPARGLEDLILAAKTINFDSWGIKAIVVAGETIPSMLRYKQGLLKLIKENNLVSRFIFLGGIDYPQMEWCYENCRVFIMTSRVESFGMIGLEAMANGCLCVAADNPCLPEIFRGCALYYKPKDAAGLAHVINLILSWKDEKKVEMSRKAQERASEFSWDKTANALIKELKNAVEINGRR